MRRRISYPQYLVYVMRICMEWRAVRFDWNRARAFLVTAEEGSFSSAGRALGIAQPTVGRQVAALESELGVTLFERIGNQLKLTAAGLDLLEHARQMGEAALRVSLAAAGQSMGLEGRVRITASDLITGRLLPPVVARLRREHPGIEIELVASNATRDLLRREADIAIRHFKPTEAELVATKIGDYEAFAYAAPAYLERLGRPRNVAELVASGAEFISFDGSALMPQALQKLGVELSVADFPIISNNHMVQWELARSGVAITFAMSTIGDADPALVRVTPDFPALPVPMWLVTHRELRSSRRIRVVFDALLEALRPPRARRLQP